MLTDREKIEIYETFLHKLQITCNVTMDTEKTKKLLNNACMWSYSHRVGNGQYRLEEQQEIIDRATLSLCDMD